MQAYKEREGLSVFPIKASYLRMFPQEASPVNEREGYTQEEASEYFSYFPYVDALLTRCPPSGINDDPTDIAHTGFIGSRDYVNREHPKLLLHGHTYPAANELVREIGSTRIEYVFGSAVIEL